VDQFPFVAKSAGYSSMLIAWSITEVIRYTYFVFTLSGYSPGIITWFRYNTFYVLYPLGISSECWLIYQSIEPARGKRQEFAWALQLILFIYVPGMFSRFLDGRLVLIIICRLVYPIHTHDGSEEEDYEEQGQGGAESRVDD